MEKKEKLEILRFYGFEQEWLDIFGIKIDGKKEVLNAKWTMGDVAMQDGINEICAIHSDLKNITSPALKHELEMVIRNKIKNLIRLIG